MVASIRNYWERLIHPAALAPLALLLLDAVRDNLTVNPIQEATLRTGKTALVLLILTLAVTPLHTLFGFRAALRWRRTLGLYTFLYAAIHLFIFVGLDYVFDWRLIQGALLEKRYALAGLAAFLVLVPLALTSTTGWQRRLKKRWKSLHRLTYVAAFLAVVHFVWLVKADIREPLLYGAVVGLLLLLRLPRLRRAASQLKHRLGRRRKTRRAGSGWLSSYR
jgi:sulfoxide reductase heme-binding subunit YedZ